METQVITRRLTPRRIEILDAVGRYIKEHGYSPSLSEIGAIAKLSLTSVARHVNALEVAGYIERPLPAPGALRRTRAITITRRYAIEVKTCPMCGRKN